MKGWGPGWMCSAVSPGASTVHASGPMSTQCQPTEHPRSPSTFWGPYQEQSCPAIWLWAFLGASTIFDQEYGKFHYFHDERRLIFSAASTDASN